MKKKAFTLIELIAVLVILAILALIVTPLVMNIIRKARIAADKRSIDAYGRSIEIAIAGYLLDNGTFPTSIGQLTIEYSGDEVVCSTTQLNSDSSVYLSGCTVDGRTVEGYTYGKEETVTYDSYEVGDQVTYNNVNYYVIADSGTNESIVTLLKSEPLTVAEVNQYGVGHINRYTYISTGMAYDQNGYGGMAYYTSETCGFVNGQEVETGCTTDYAQSEVKYVVDAWKTAKAPLASEARLITYEELVNNLGCTSDNCNNSLYNWLYNNDYWYWTSSPFPYWEIFIWNVTSGAGLSSNCVYNNGSYMVRPVIVINKSALSN